MKKRLIILILFVFSFFSFENIAFSKLSEITKEKSYCNATDLINYFIPDRKIESIKITFNNERKWSKNLFNALISPSQDIQAKFKKKFKASLAVTFIGGITCDFSAKIRFSGDKRDHIIRVGGKIISSMDVEINENINGVTKFKLFLPHTKKNENEIFITALLNNLGYLSARTEKIKKVNISGKEHPYLFSESVHRKEFLEQNNRNEGPILSLDEFYIMNSNPKFNEILIARIRNSKWIKDDNQKFKKSVKALTFLNYHFINIAERNKPLINPTNGMEKIFFEENSLERKKFMKYMVLIHALATYSHLAEGDLRFYFNPMIEKFEIIYNDGFSTIMGIPKKIKYNLLNKDMQIVTPSLINQIDSIDKDKFRNELRIRGLILDEKKLIKLFNKITDRIKKIRNFKKFSKNDEKYYVNNFDRYVEKLNSLNIGYIFYDSEFDNFIICRKSKCYKSNLDVIQRQDLLNQKLKIKKSKYIFLGNKFISDFKNLKIESFLNTFLKKEIDKNFAIYYNSGKIIVDNKKKTIELIHEEINSRFFIMNAKIKDYQIKTTSKESFSNNQNFLGLTGCLTFYQTFFDNVSLYSEKANCEDAINIIKSNGNINEIIAKTSKSDGLDIDFSHIRIKKLEIIESKNDCLDLSYGEYEIDIIDVNGCGDKGISIGEKSKLNSKNISIVNSKFSTAVKDGSILTVENFNATNYDICLALYRKKQEFVGAKVFIKNNNCKKKSIYIQNGSEIKGF